MNHKRFVSTLLLMLPTLLTTGCVVSQREALVAPPQTVYEVAPQTQQEEGIKKPEVSSEQEKRIYIRVGSGVQAEPLKESLASKTVFEGTGLALNYNDVNVRDVIKQVVEIFGLNYTIDEDVQGKVTIKTAKMVESNRLWDVFKYVLSLSGVGIVEEGDFVRFTKVSGQLTNRQLQLGKPTGYSDGVIMYLHPLEYITTDKALGALTPMVTDAMRMYPIDGLNAVVLLGQEKSVGSFAELLSTLDTDPFRYRSIAFFPVKHAKASELTMELQSIFKTVERDASVYQFVSLDRVNSIFVSAPPGKDFDSVKFWISRLDSLSGQSSKRFFVYPLSNSKAEDIAATLANLVQESTAEQVTAAPRVVIEKKAAENTNQEKVSNPASSSDQGVSFSLGDMSIVADQSTNSLVIEASRDNFEKLKLLLDSLDASPATVMINVMIAEVTLDNDHELGIEWSLTRGGFSFSNELGLTSANSSGQLLGLIASSSSTDIRAILNAMQKKQVLKVLSSPSILVRNNEEAKIEIGQEVPIITRQITSSTADTNKDLTNEVQYKTTGVLLNVTPVIDRNNRISLAIKQEVSNAVTNQTGNIDSPVISKRLIETKVIANDGETIVLGGIMDQSSDVTDTGIPVLMDIPLIGGLFKKQVESVVKTELLVILRPQVVRSGASDGTKMLPAFLSSMKHIDEILSGSNWSTSN